MAPDQARLDHYANNDRIVIHEDLWNAYCTLRRFCRFLEELFDACRRELRSHQTLEDEFIATRLNDPEWIHSHSSDELVVHSWKKDDAEKATGFLAHDDWRDGRMKAFPTKAEFWMVHLGPEFEQKYGLEESYRYRTEIDPLETDLKRFPHRWLCRQPSYPE